MQSLVVFVERERLRDGIALIEPIVQVEQLAALRAEGSRAEIFWYVLEHLLADGTLDAHVPGHTSSNASVAASMVRSMTSSS